MLGKLYMWGTDENGFYKFHVDCYDYEIADVLGRYDYDDCDWIANN